MIFFYSFFWIFFADPVCKLPGMGHSSMFRAPTRFQIENSESVTLAREKLPPVEEVNLCCDKEQP